MTSETMFAIGARSRGAAAPPGDILAPPGRLLPPSDLYPGPFLGQNASNPRRCYFFCFCRKRLILGQKGTPIPLKTFFLENACFWDKRQSNFSEEPYFAFQTLVSAPLMFAQSPSIGFKWEIGCTVPKNSNKSDVRC